jgi:hypothetical protein
VAEEAPVRCPDDATLWAYLESELGANARAEIEPHVGSCELCARALDRVLVSRTVVRAVAAASPTVEWRAVDLGLRAAATARIARRWPWPEALAVVSAAAVFGLVWLLGQPRRAEIAIEAVSGAGFVRASGDHESIEAALVAGSTLRAGAILATGEAGSALVRLPDASRASFGARTRAIFARASRDEIEIHLVTGSVAIDASHVERSEFVVDAGSARVHVVGTAFRVGREQEEVAVAVARGRVRVDAEGRAPTFVDAGQRLVTGAGGVALAEAPLTVADEEAFALLGVEPERPRVGNATADGEAANAPATDAVERPRTTDVRKRKQSPTRRRGSALVPPSAERARESGFPITGEGLFLQRAKESLETGTCPRYLAGLAEVVEWSPDATAREVAHILRARCYDVQRLRVQAKLEYRRYLEQYPFGRFTAEAARALRR